MVAPAQRRNVVRHYQAVFKVSERRALRVFGFGRSTHRYQGCKDDCRLADQPGELAAQRPRYGYRRLHVLLRRQGELVNHKRVYRVYRAEG